MALPNPLDPHNDLTRSKKKPGIAAPPGASTATAASVAAANGAIAAPKLAAPQADTYYDKVRQSPGARFPRGDSGSRRAATRQWRTSVGRWRLRAPVR